MENNFYVRELRPVLEGGPALVIEYLRSKGLLIQNFVCPACSEVTKEITSTRNADGKIFRCYNTRCSKYKKFYSIRVNSFFNEFKISLRESLTLIWKWGGEITQKEVMREVPISPSAIIKIFNLLRTLCCRYFMQNPVILGGSGVLCQIDESLFRHKPKNHRGRAPEHKLWVFGIADTSYTPAKVYLKLVENRSAATLVPIICEKCRPGSIIVSDEWAAYRSLAFSSDFEYRAVNHSLFFVDPNTGAHTQAIESYWGKAKLRIKRQKGIYGTLLSEYLNVFMFRDNIYRGNFQEIIDLIKFYY